ncbi:MAG: ribosome silencing factor, partial [Rickettsiales bacterium]|nr:ribosome silencing factor [Rickettsiales bacterium]
KCYVANKNNGDNIRLAKHFENGMLKDLQKFVVEVLDDIKIENIEAIDVEKKTSLTKLILIGTGRSTKHLDSSMEKLRSELKTFGITPPKAEGKGIEWLLLDLGDILVNLFTEEERKKYDIEKLWKKER